MTDLPCSGACHRTGRAPVGHRFPASVGILSSMRHHSSGDPPSMASGGGDELSLRGAPPLPDLPRAGRLRVEVVEEVGVHRGPSSAVPSSRPIEEKWFGLSRYPPWSCRVQDPALPLQKPRNGLGATPQIRECGVGVYPNATGDSDHVSCVAVKLLNYLLSTGTRKFHSGSRPVSPPVLMSPKCVSRSGS